MSHRRCERAVRRRLASNEDTPVTHPVPLPGVLPVTRGLAVPSCCPLLIAACLLVASIAGLAFGQRGLYEPNPATLPAFLAQDVLSLLVGLPLLLGSAWLAGRRCAQRD